MLASSMEPSRKCCIKVEAIKQLTKEISLAFYNYSSRTNALAFVIELMDTFINCMMRAFKK